MIWGLCYEMGTGVEVDLKRATDLYRRSGEQDYAPGQCNLAVCYLNGDGVEKDAAQAAAWLRRAAALDFPRAQSILADCYRDGDGVPGMTPRRHGFINWPPIRGIPRAVRAGSLL